MVRVHTTDMRQNIIDYSYDERSHGDTYFTDHPDCIFEFAAALYTVRCFYEKDSSKFKESVCGGHSL
jgi:hypothetical protein